MDAGFGRTLTALAIVSILGSDFISGLTLCDNTSPGKPIGRSSFPRNAVCKHLPSCDGGKKCSFAKISCPRNQSIYDPKVQGIHSSDEGTCTGHTIKLMIERTDCFWKNMCTVKYPEVPVIVKHLDGEESCLGKCIHQVHVRSWQCIKDEMIHIMCDDSKDFIINQTKDGHQGVVRSHDGWPFMYNDHVVPGGVSECNKTFHPHLKGVNKGFTRVALLVDFLDIRSGYETLFAESGGKVVAFNNTDKPKVFVSDEGQKVVLSLRKVQGISEKDRRIVRSGFVICFKFLRKGDSAGDNICREVFKDNRKDAKCVNCKYKRPTKRSRPLLDYCMADSLGVRVYNVSLANPNKQLKDGCSPWTRVDKPCRKKTRNPDKRRSQGTKKRKRKKKNNRGKGKGKRRRGSRG